MKHLHLIAVFMAVLIVMLPVCFADELRLQYDANGNVVYDGQYYREYNGFNQLFSIRNGSNSSSPLMQEYDYDPLEERIFEKRSYFMNGSLKERVIYWDSDYVTIINSSGTYNYEYYSAQGELMAQKNPDGSMLYMESDIKGNIVAVMNSSGAVIENTTYSPYGEILSGGKASKFNYEKKEYDSVVGDLDFNFRKFNPSLAFFLQPDNVVQNEYDPQSLNRYMFEQGNPYVNSDPTGHWIESALDIASIAYDVYTLSSEEGRSDWVNWASLGVDIVCLALPIVAGGGVGLRAATGTAKIASKVDDAADTAKLIDKTVDVAKGSDKVLDAGKTTEKAANSLKGASNPQTQKAIAYGLEQHKAMGKSYAEAGYSINKAIPGTNGKLRPDAINWKTKTITEFKPDSVSGIRKGKTQLDQYKSAAQAYSPGVWKTELKTYKSLPKSMK